MKTRKISATHQHAASRTRWPSILLFPALVFLGYFSSFDPRGGETWLL